MAKKDKIEIGGLYHFLPTQYIGKVDVSVRSLDNGGTYNINCIYVDSNGSILSINCKEEELLSSHLPWPK